MPPSSIIQRLSETNTPVSSGQSYLFLFPNPQENDSAYRFKIAAQQNSTKWYNSRLHLLPSLSPGLVQIYDLQTKSFIDHPNSTIHNPLVSLDGPFIYFLSTVNVDRLEPAFRITPFARSLPPSSPSCDIVIIRPFKCPTILEDSPRTRANFVPLLWSILGAAYQDGLHVEMRYNKDGQIVTQGDGPAVVEYIRCGGWKWIPVRLHHPLLNLHLTSA